MEIYIYMWFEWCSSSFGFADLSLIRYSDPVIDRAGFD